MVPTLLTMFISGVWHGAGYNFIIWGLLHGLYLVINHAWRLVGPKLCPDRASYDRFMTPVGLILTFVSVSAAMVFFRAPAVASAMDLLKGMIGLNGLALPPGSSQDIVMILTWIVGLTIVALGCPNTLQILAQYEPALGVKPRPIRFWSAKLIE